MSCEVGVWELTEKKIGWYANFALKKHGYIPLNTGKLCVNLITCHNQLFVSVARLTLNQVAHRESWDKQMDRQKTDIQSDDTWTNGILNPVYPPPLQGGW